MIKRIKSAFSTAYNSDNVLLAKLWLMYSFLPIANLTII